MNSIESGIQEYGFAIVDRYLDAGSIELLIADITALNINIDRAGIRNLLELVPSVAQLARSQEIRSIVEPILGDTARVVRGIFFDKQPTANWKVPWHQDLSIAIKQHREVTDYLAPSIKAGIPHIQPPRAILEQMLTVRIHLDRCDRSNGALKVIPGSHLQGKLTSAEIDLWKQTVEISCDLDVGGILLMRPLLLHASSVATVPTHRRVIHLEYANCDLPGGLEWYYRDSG
jgi:ectoine hydroxylase-related dioxygenase (phytanoyl-CoA dioxygenase family)